MAWPALAAETQSWRVVGQVGGPVRCVAVQGTRGWAGVGMRVVELDVSNPAAIREVGATPAFPRPPPAVIAEVFDGAR
jgi:hypothetical protein